MATRLLESIELPSSEAAQGAPLEYSDDDVKGARVLAFAKHIIHGITIFRLTLDLPRRDRSWLSIDIPQEEWWRTLSPAAQQIIQGAIYASPKEAFVFGFPQELASTHKGGQCFKAHRMLPGFFGCHCADVAKNENILYLGRDNHGNEFPLDIEYVQTKMGNEFLDRLDDFAWHRVDPGSRSGLRKQSQKVVCTHSILRPKFCNFTRIRYRQQDGEFKCYIRGLASAIATAGMLSESRELHHQGCLQPVDQRTNDYIHRTVEKYFRGRFYFKKCRKRNRFNPLARCCPHVTVVLLKQKQKDAYPHCVTFYKNWIFDSSFDYALKRTRDNLDYICGGSGNYVGIWWAKQLLPIAI
jgi:hypothetical protein